MSIRTGLCLPARRVPEPFVGLRINAAIVGFRFCPPAHHIADRDPRGGRDTIVITETLAPIGAALAVIVNIR